MPLTYEELVKQRPEDAICAFCGKKNDYWDQDGFFYLWTRDAMSFEQGQAACKECTNGKPGKLHHKLHGKGNEKRK